MASDYLKYVYIAKDPGPRAFTMPKGFEETVEVHLWGAGGGAGYGGAPGGGGGYVKSTLTIAEGDIVEIGIGYPGSPAQSADSPGQGGGSGIGTRYSGGRGGARGSWCGNVNGPMASGGGGGASAILINGVARAVAAGGGGGGGFGHKGVKFAGNPGGVYSSLTGNTQGAAASYGGGGGGGYQGGNAGGRSGHAVTGGGGGQNYGDVTVAGSGSTAGGRGTEYAPPASYGNSGYGGYVVLVLTRKYNVKIKDSGDWKQVNRAFVKTPETVIYTDVVPEKQTERIESVGSGVWTVPNNVNSVTVTVIGGGGSGASGHEINPNTEGGGGGGSGGVNRQTISVTPGQQISYTVGAGGIGVPTAGYDGGRNGNPGQSSSFGSITATGGGAGISRPTAGGAAGSPGGTAGSAGESRGGDTTSAGGNGGGVPGYSTGGTGGARGSNAGSAGVGPGAGSGGGGGVGGSGVPTMGGSANGRAGQILLEYTPTPRVVRTTTGGWKEVTQIYEKFNGEWVPFISRKNINDGRTERFLVPGTYNWTAPADVIRVKAVVYGAGGSGTGGAGGAGGYSEKYLTVTPGSTYPLVVGAGGIGSQAGGASSFNGTIIANGGGAGAAATGGTDAGGAGGTATGGDTNLTGASGSSGRALYSYYYWWWGWGGFWGWGGYNYYNYGRGAYNYGYWGTGGGFFNSFAEGTMISTPSGDRAIETIAEGDVVYAFDVASSGEVRYDLPLVEKTVTKTSKSAYDPRHDSQLVEISFNGGSLSATNNHEILTSSKQGAHSPTGFARADELEVGDVIYDKDGNEVVITALTPIDTYEYVYDFSVEGYHTFIANNIRVHNINWWGGYWGWGWPRYQYAGYDFGEPGVGYDGIGSGAVGRAADNPEGAPGAVIVIY